MGPCSQCGAMVNHRENDGVGCSLGEEAVLRTEYELVKAERDAYLAQLSEVQARCTELLEEVRRMKSNCLGHHDEPAAAPTDGRRNAGVLCDTVEGPCACGAWHGSGAV